MATDRLTAEEREHAIKELLAHAARHAAKAQLLREAADVLEESIEDVKA